jgi:hypothetical protein
MLDDPRVNFAISTREGRAAGISHLGIQAEDETELAEVYDRLSRAERPITTALENGAQPEVCKKPRALATQALRSCMIAVDTTLRSGFAFCHLLEDNFKCERRHSY